MRYIILLIVFMPITGCSSEKAMQKIIFLHHSTGRSVWVGNTNRYVYRLANKGHVQRFFEKYNRINKTNYQISNRIFPMNEPYGWNNYPYDYYNIWVKNAGKIPYMGEPTLEILTASYDIIIFKHCFPVGNIMADNGKPDIDSPEKKLENYKLQYNALKSKMHEFPNKKFIVWTPPASVKTRISENEARRTREFYKWMIEEWNEKGDNIFIWDFFKYQTEGGLYLPEKNAYSRDNSHPGKEFSANVAPKFASYIIDVIESPPGIN